MMDSSDCQVHRRAHWPIAIKIQSIQIMLDEYFNEQNRKGERIDHKIPLIQMIII